MSITYTLVSLYTCCPRQPAKFFTPWSYITEHFLLHIHKKIFSSSTTIALDESLFCKHCCVTLLCGHLCQRLTPEPLHPAPEQFLLHCFHLCCGTGLGFILLEIVPDGVPDGVGEDDADGVAERVRALALGWRLRRFPWLSLQLLGSRGTLGALSVLGLQGWDRWLVVVAPGEGLQDKGGVLPIEQCLGDVDSHSLQALGQALLTDAAGWVSAAGVCHRSLFFSHLRPPRAFFIWGHIKSYLGALQAFLAQRAIINAFDFYVLHCLLPVLLVADLWGCLTAWAGSWVLRAFFKLFGIILAPECWARAPWTTQLSLLLFPVNVSEWASHGSSADTWKTFLLSKEMTGLSSLGFTLVKTVQIAQM